MPIAFPEPTEAPGQEPESQQRRPDERDRSRPRTRTREEGPAGDEAPAAPQGEESAGGEVVIFPGGQVAVPPAAWAAAQEWWADARRAAARAADGSIWRARPPALRDSVVRLARAEWAGGITVLRWAGWIYGAPAQAVRAVLLVACWLLDHPSRLLVAGGVVVAALFLY